MDGRLLDIPQIEPREWTIPTLGGTWVGDLGGRIPEDLTSLDLRFEDYLRVGDEYIHETLVTADEAPPTGWLIRIGVDQAERRQHGRPGGLNVARATPACAGDGLRQAARATSVAVGLAGSGQSVAGSG